MVSIRQRLVDGAPLCLALQDLVPCLGSRAVVSIINRGHGLRTADVMSRLAPNKIQLCDELCQVCWMGANMRRNPADAFGVTSKPSWHA